MKELSNITPIEEEKKKVVEIKAADLQLLMNECCLSRQDAIDLLQKMEGDIKSSLNYFIN